MSLNPIKSIKRKQELRKQELHEQIDRSAELLQPGFTGSYDENGTVAVVERTEADLRVDCQDVLMKKILNEVKIVVSQDPESPQEKYHYSRFLADGEPIDEFTRSRDNLTLSELRLVAHGLQAAVEAQNN